MPRPQVEGAARRLDAGGAAKTSAERTLLPGLVDLHCHVDPSGRPGVAGAVSRYGLDPDAAYLPRGVTTVLSQGDAGTATAVGGEVILNPPGVYSLI